MEIGKREIVPGYMSDVFKSNTCCALYIRSKLAMFFSPSDRFSGHLPLITTNVKPAFAEICSYI